MDLLDRFEVLWEDHILPKGLGLTTLTLLGYGAITSFPEILSDRQYLSFTEQKETNGLMTRIYDIKIDPNGRLYQEEKK
jgi:hypothetical protein